VIIESVSGGNILLFDSEKHTYKLNGEYTYGVTTINKKGYPISPHLLRWMMARGIKKSKKEAEEAASIGKLVHSYAENYEHHKKTPDDLHDNIIFHKDKALVLNCIKKFRRWERENQDKLIGSEGLVASVEYNFAGTFDRLAQRKNEVVLSDFKTSSGIYTEQFIQISAYALALWEWRKIKVDVLEVIRFGKDSGEFETKQISNIKQIVELQEQFIRNLHTMRFIENWDAKEGKKK
jgi:hypothetical protein